MMNDIYYRIARMPPRIRSYVAEDADGDYTVTLNDYLSDEALQRKIRHELKHIRNEDTHSEAHFSILEMMTVE